MTQLGSRRLAAHLLAILCLGFALSACEEDGRGRTAPNADESGGAASRAAEAPPAPDPAATPAPLPQQQLAAIVVEARTRLEADGMEAALEARDRALCTLMETIGYEADGWTGTYRDSVALSQGRLVQIEIAPGAWLVATRVGRNGDRIGDTLLRPDTPLYALVAGLEPGTPVVLSGRFVRHAPDAGPCIRPTGGTSAFAQIQSPNYWIELTDLSPATPR